MFASAMRGTKYFTQRDRRNVVFLLCVERTHHMAIERLDKKGPHRVAFERNKKRILKTKHTCGICGRDVDKSLVYPHPLSPVIDHIIPVSKGGHPSNMDNLQLTHWKCNRDKSDKLYTGQTNTTETIGNRNLPKTLDWASYEFKT